MARRGSGKIVVTSSIAGLQPYLFLAPNTVSKHAVEAILQLVHTKLAPVGVQVAIINPGPFDIGFNERMYDTVDQWFTPIRNFTPEEPLRDMQGMFANPDFQYDQRTMVDVMIQTLPQETHRFRTVFPKSSVRLLCSIRKTSGTRISYPNDICGEVKSDDGCRHSWRNAGLSRERVGGDPYFARPA